MILFHAMFTGINVTPRTYCFRAQMIVLQMVIWPLGTSQIQILALLVYWHVQNKQKLFQHAVKSAV